MKKYEGKGVADALRLAAEAGANGETILEKTVMINGGLVIFKTNGVVEEVETPPQQEEYTTEPDESVFDREEYIDIIEGGTKATIIEAFSEIGVELDGSLNKGDLKKSAYEKLGEIEA
ncbi:MAG: hypothetical protein GOVbin4162_50 [Prokaryotic dsDNA virus sp.]|nr:MAG: hypothetical protein GOVbin4162_50 [Prokaryotic dsDNA virus sp.]|tara:strand:+ start:541 stop:894 length:354 start_codon:yes stop_codon:yes gene_type:complete